MRSPWSDERILTPENEALETVFGDAVRLAKRTLDRAERAESLLASTTAEAELQIRELGARVATLEESVKREEHRNGRCNCLECKTTAEKRKQTPHSWSPDVSESLLDLHHHVIGADTVRLDSGGAGNGFCVIHRGRELLHVRDEPLGVLLREALNRLPSIIKATIALSPAPAIEEAEDAAEEALAESIPDDDREWFACQSTPNGPIDPPRSITEAKIDYLMREAEQRKARRAKPSPISPPTTREACPDCGWPKGRDIGECSKWSTAPTPTAEADCLRAKREREVRDGR